MFFINWLIPMFITFVCIAIYVSLSVVFLKNENEHKRLLPVRIVFIMLVVLEIAKIVYLIGRDDYYFANRFPIVFCSMSMYAYPVFCFKNNRFSDIAKGFSIIPGIIAFIFFAAIQWKYDMSLMQVHSYIYHGSMLGVAVYLIASKLYVFKFKKFYAQALTVGIYFLSASFISLLIGGAISVFGPKDPYLAFLYNAAGFMPGILILVFAVFFAYFAVYGIIELCSRAGHKRMLKKAAHTTEGEMNGND